MPAAHETLLPPKVEKKMPWSTKVWTISGRVITAPSGWPLPIGLPRQTMSGTTSCNWKPHIASPWRPKPVCTSSATARPPALRTRS